MRLLTRYLSVVIVVWMLFAFLFNSGTVNQSYAYCDSTLWHDATECTGTAPNCEKTQYNDCNPSLTRVVSCTGGSCNYGTSPTPTPGGTIVWVNCGVQACNGSVIKCTPDCQAGSTCYPVDPCTGDGCCSSSSTCLDQDACSNCDPGSCFGYCEYNAECSSGNACVYRCEATNTPAPTSPTPTIPPSCGNGTYEPLLGEQCDEGSNNSDVNGDACRTDCQWPICGDGVRDSGNSAHPPGVDEECDDSNSSNTDFCSNQCFITPKYSNSCSGVVANPYVYESVGYSYGYTASSNAQYFTQFTPSLILDRGSIKYSFDSASPNLTLEDYYTTCSGYSCSFNRSATLAGSSIVFSGQENHTLTMGVNLWNTIDGVANVGCAWNGAWTSAPNTNSTSACTNSCAVTKPVLNAIQLSCSNLLVAQNWLQPGDSITVGGSTLNSSSNVSIINTALKYRIKHQDSSYTAWADVTGCTGDLDTGVFSCTFTPSIIATDQQVEFDMRPHVFVSQWNNENGVNGRDAHGGTATSGEEFVCQSSGWQVGYGPNDHPSTSCTNTCNTAVVIGASPTPTPTATPTATPVATSTPTATPTTPVGATNTPTATPTTPVAATNTPTPTITPLPTATPTPTPPVATPTPTNSPTPTPTTPPSVAQVYGYVSLDTDPASNCDNLPISGGQFDDPGLCYTRVVRQSITGGLPTGYDNGFGYYCFTEETNGNWYLWGSDPEASVVRRSCQFSGTTLEIRDDNNDLYPNQWYPCVTNLNQANYPQLYNTDGDFVGGQVTCAGAVANYILGGKNFRIYPKYVSYTCGGGYRRSGYGRMRSFPQSFNSYSAGIAITTPSVTDPFPGSYYTSRSDSGVGERIKIDNSFNLAEVDETAVYPASRLRNVTYFLGTTSGPHNFCFDVPLVTSTPTPTPTNTPTPTATPTITPTPTPATIDAWWQIQGGTAYSSGLMSSMLPEPTPPVYLLDKINGSLTSLSAGLPMCGAPLCDVTIGTWPFENHPSANFTTVSDYGAAIGSSNTVCATNSFDTFAEMLDLGSATNQGSGGPSTVTSFNNLFTNADSRTGYKLYYHPGDLSIDINNDAGLWNIPAGSKVIVVVGSSSDPTPSTLNIGDTGTNSHMTLPTSSYLGFYVNGNITFEQTVGNVRADTSDLANVRGVFFSTDGQIIIEGVPVANRPTDELRFVGQGTFIGCDGVQLNRDFEDTTNKTEVFQYNPNLLNSVPEVLQEAHITWQEKI